MQEDPIWDDNLYAYCANNPLNLVDPFGLRHGGAGNGSGGTFIMPGTIAGAQAGQWYANQQMNSCSWWGWAWAIPGVAASAWTPQTWAQTSLTLIGGAAVAPWAARTGPWLGTIAYHTAHGLAHGGKAHIQVMIRVGLHLTKHWRLLLPW